MACTAHLYSRPGCNGLPSPQDVDGLPVPPPRLSLNKLFTQKNAHRSGIFVQSIPDEYTKNAQNLYWSAKGWTIPFSTTAGSVCVAKQFRTRYKGYFITKNPHRSGDSVQAIPDQYKKCPKSAIKWLFLVRCLLLLPALCSILTFSFSFPHCSSLFLPSSPARFAIFSSSLFTAFFPLPGDS